MLFGTRSMVACLAAAVTLGCGVTETSSTPPETEAFLEPSAAEEVPQTCSPVTCAAAQATCGAISDGCGATLQCGECSGYTRCGALNTCTPSPTKPVWGRVFEAGAYAVDDGGNILVLVTGTPMRFLRFTPSGEVIGEQHLDAGTRISRGFFRIGDSGTRFFVFNRYCHAGCSAGALGTSENGGWTAIRVSSEGVLEWAQDIAGEVRDAAVGADGELLVLTAPPTKPDDAMILWIDRAGRHARKLAIEAARSIATDSMKNLLVGGAVLSSAAEGHRKAYVTKLSPNGDVVWTRTSGDEAGVSVDFVGTAADGTLVATFAVYAGTLEWNGQSFSYEAQPGAEARTLLVQLDDEGDNRWTRFESSWTRLGAVTSASRFAAVLRANENCWRIKAWGEGGADAWSEPLGAGCDPPNDVVNATSIAAVGDTLAVAGSFGGDMDFGGGEIAVHGGFLQVHAH